MSKRKRKTTRIAKRTSTTYQDNAYEKAKKDVYQAYLIGGIPAVTELIKNLQKENDDLKKRLKETHAS